MLKRRHWKTRIPELFQGFRIHIVESPGKEETWTDILELEKETKAHYLSERLHHFSFTVIIILLSIFYYKEWGPSSSFKEYFQTITLKN